MHRLHLVGVERVRGPERVHACTPKRLIRIDVADARDRALVEQRRLDRRTPVREALREVSRLVCRTEWLTADSGVDVGLDLVGLEQEPRAEAPDVTVGDARAVIQLDHRAAVRVVAFRPGAVQHRPGHAQVDQQRPTRLEAHDQVLAAAVDRGDALALELAVRPLAGPRDE